MSDTRSADLQQLRREYKETKDRGLKKAIRETGERIRKEDRDIKSMRERLIKEHRKGNIENIKDIHEFIKDKSRYQNA